MHLLVVIQKVNIGTKGGANQKPVLKVHTAFFTMEESGFDDDDNNQDSDDHSNIVDTEGYIGGNRNVTVLVDVHDNQETGKYIYVSKCV